MKEIKYRVWQPTDKKFYYWGFIDDAFIGIPLGAGITLEYAKKNSQQYANITDKNNKEIYAGDFLRIIWKTAIELDERDGTKEASNWTCIVIVKFGAGEIEGSEWSHDMIGFYLDRISEKNNLREVNLTVDMKKEYDVELIGNIMENRIK